jgi:biotin carboxylase
VVLFGWNLTTLTGWRRCLPDASVLVIEEPDVIRKRGLDRAVPGLPVVQELIPCDYQVRESLEALIAHDGRLRCASGVGASVEYGVETAAEVAERLCLPGIGRRAAGVFRDKWELRGLAGRAGVRSPRHALVAGPREAEAFLRSAGGPCVLKPTTRHANLGVQIVDREEDVARAWWEAWRPAEEVFAPDRGIPSRVLMERAVPGPAYSVELLVRAGRTCFANVTRKQVLRGRYPVEIGHAAPAPLDARATARLVCETERLVAAAGFGSGVVHCEWIVDGAGPVLVECAARLPGDRITTLLSRVHGFSLVEAYLSVLVGEPPLVCCQPLAAAAIRFITAEPGTVTAVAGLERARAVPGVELVELSVGPGDRVRRARSSWDRVGFAIASADTPDRAAAIAGEACGLVRVDT